GSRMLAALCTNRSLWALALLYFCGSFGWSFFVSWVPKYLLQVHGVAFSKSELRTGLPLLCGGITCLVGGWMSDALVRRTGRKWLMRAIFPVSGSLVAAAAMLSVQYAATPNAAVALICLAAAALDFGQGANWATIVD